MNEEESVTIFYLIEVSPYSIQVVVRDGHPYYRALDILRSIMLVNRNIVLDKIVKKICTDNRLKYSDVVFTNNSFLFISETVSNKLIEKHLDKTRIRRGRGRPPKVGVSDE